MLTHGFITKQVKTEDLAKSPGVSSRVKYMLPTFTGPMSTCAQGQSAAHRCGQVFLNSQEAADQLSSFIPKEKVVTAEKLTAVGMKKEDVAKAKSAAVWAQRAEPEGRYIGSEFGEVGCVRLSLQGKRRVAVASVRKLVQFFSVEGKKLSCDGLMHTLEVATEEQVTKLLDDHVLRWGSVQPDSLIYIPQGHIVIDSTLGDKPSLGVKCSVLVSGVGEADMEALHDLYLASNKQGCADCSKVALKAIVTE